MTKEKMLNFIEATGMAINFDRKYLMRHSKEYITSLYVAAMHYAARFIYLDVTRIRKILNLLLTFL